MVVIALLAFTTRSYRLITAQYRAAPEAAVMEAESAPSP